jgi:hypothetical protein
MSVILTGSQKKITFDRKLTSSEMRGKMKIKTYGNNQRNMNLLSAEKEGVKFEFKLRLKGLGFSMIDNTPKELMYISLNKLQFVYRESIKKRPDDSGMLEKLTDYEF